jgi:hypothetical protein
MSMTMTVTLSSTPSATATPLIFTPTPTVVISQAFLAVKDVQIYPNPVNPDKGGQFDVAYYITQDVNSVCLKAYSNAFRLVKTIVLSGYDTAGPKIKPVYSRNLYDCAGGSYFYYIEASGAGGWHARSRVNVMIIMK